MDTNKVLSLIKAICVRTKELEAYLTKTKLLKLLYLIDVEYYRKYDRTFTEFSWIFYEFGPWAYEYNEVFNQIKSSIEFHIEERKVPEEAFLIFFESEHFDITYVFPEPADSMLFREIIDKWAHEALNELLNFVYFFTEPMDGAIKHKALDFSKIKNIEKIPDFHLQKGNLSDKQKKVLGLELKKKLREKKSTLAHEKVKSEYDDIYWSVIEKMDFDSDY